MHVDLPHRLGKQGAKARLADNAHKLKDHIPGQMAEVTTAWHDDVLRIAVAAMGQKVVATATVGEDVVRCDIQLPALLGFFEAPIRAAIESQGPKLLA